MTSKAVSQNEFLYPKASVEVDIELKPHFYRRPTVYDAVDGRISVGGFITKKEVISSTRDTVSSSVAAISPEAVLFRSKTAPTRYAENDIYFANERKGAILPESDLLKAIHCYTSDFYSRNFDCDKCLDFQSLDESALLAFGILLEEQMRKTLGDTGDLAFTEGAQFSELAHDSKATSSKNGAKRRRVAK